MSRTYPQEVIDYVLRDAAAGIPVDRIRARVFVWYGYKLSIETICQMTEQSKPFRIYGTQNGLIPMRLSVIDPDKISSVFGFKHLDMDDLPEFRNLWALLTTARRDVRLLVHRSKFKSRGDRYYVVIGEDGKIKTKVWAPTNDAFIRHLRKIGIRAFYIDPMQMPLFTVDQKQKEAA